MFLTTIELIVAILITDIYYVFTLAPAVNIQKMLQTSKFCQQHPKLSICSEIYQLQTFQLLVLLQLSFLATRILIIMNHMKLNN